MLSRTRIALFLPFFVCLLAPITGWATTYPVTDSFGGSGALSSNWTNTTAAGEDYVAVDQNGGSAGLTVSGQQGLAIYTGATFTNDQYAQTTFVNHSAEGGYTGVCVRMNTSGNGVCYLADYGVVYALVDGEVTYDVVSGCPIPASGDTIRLSAVGGIYTCKDVTTGASALGWEPRYSFGSPAILIDQTESTVYALAQFQADCSPSCNAFSGSGAAAYPLIDSFSGSGALSSSWTNTTSTNGYVALAQNSGIVDVSVSGQAGLAIYTGAAFSDDQYAQATFVNAPSDGATGVCVRMDTSGTGVCYLAEAGLIFSLLGGSGDGEIASDCPIPSSGDVIQLSASGPVYTCKDVTTGVSSTGVDWGNSTGNPAILVDQQDSATEALSQFHADCVPSCSSFSSLSIIISLGSFATTATNPGFANTATVYAPDISMVNSGSTATYGLSSCASPKL